MHVYRILESHEELKHERIVADTAVEVAALADQSISGVSMKLPAMRFMVESLAGELQTDRPVSGWQQERNIYVLQGLRPIDLGRVVFHEVKHVSDFDQHSKERWFSNANLRERSACLFELEFGSQIRGTSYREVFHSLHELRERIEADIALRSTHDVRKTPSGMRLITPNKATMEEALKRQILGY